MTGSLQVKNGRFHMVLNYIDEFGQRKVKWISTKLTVKGNKRKAEEMLRNVLAEEEERKTVYSNNVGFVDWMQLWLEQKKADIQKNTYEGYMLYFDIHIEPFFKPLKLTLKSVTPQHIQNYFNRKLKEGLSANSLKRHSVVIRGALQEALKKNIIPYNPMDRVTMPKIKKFVGKYYTAEQAKALLSVIDNEAMKPVIILGLFYGLRRSEAIGLRWEDVNFAENTIQIRNTVVKTKTLIEHEHTKSEASRRTLYIIPETKEYFQMLKAQQEDNKQMFGAEYSNSNHVCTWPDGRGFTPDYVSQRFSRILEMNQLPHIRFHELRHTAGSLLLAKGLSIKQIQEYLGHEKVSTTLDIYGHLSLEGKQEAAQVIGGMLNVSL